MRKRRKLIWILLGCALVVVLLLTFSREREPQYHGRSLSQWLLLLEGGHSNEPDISLHDAEEAMRHIGTNALPSLLKWLNYREQPWRTNLQTFSKKLPQKVGYPLSRLALGHGPELQWMALSSLYFLGADAKPAIPAVTNLMASQPPYTVNGVLALAQIGGDGLPTVLNVLTNQANPWRLAAIDALADLDRRRPLDPLIVSALTNCLADTNREFAICAAEILCRHNSEKELSIKTLVDALGSGNMYLEANAMRRLQASIKLDYSTPTLIQILQDTNSLLSAYAADKLGATRVKLRETVLPVLTNALHDPRPLVRSYTARAISHLSEAAEPAASALLDLWNDPDQSVRQSATNAFFDLWAYAVLRQADQLRIYPAGMNEEEQAFYKVSWPRLVRLLDHPDLRVREMATNALQKFKQASGEMPAAQTPSRQP
jgi:hypothetical protein